MCRNKATTTRLQRCCCTLALFLLALHPSIVAATAMEVIQLSYRPAKEIIPMLRPLLDPASKISGMNYQLIVRAHPDQIKQIRNLLKTLDKRPQSLMISVVQDIATQNKIRSMAAGANVSLGKHGSIKIGETPPITRHGATLGLGNSDSNATLAYLHQDKSITDNSMQKVRVLEGGQAYIRVANSRPIRQRVRTRQGWRFTEHEYTTMQQASTGFYVIPRISDQEVILEITPHKQRFDRGSSASMDSQEVSTIVRGRLGQWLDIGSGVATANNNSTALLSSDTSENNEQRKILVKVDTVQ